MDAVQLGDVLNKEDMLKDGYWVHHTTIGSFNTEYVTITSFHCGDDIVLCFVNSSNTGLHYCKMFSVGHMTKEQFFSKLTEHPPLFEWVLFNLEIFESK